ncbi:MAG TPA: family 1 glycosylhydrolase [Allosphingosinicella sp.]|jgi:beta-glucosidase/6-phospho-beta-glucosidase/beta-galactosidase
MSDDPDAFRFYVARRVSNPTTARFLFATGIECSYPMISTPEGDLRRDQMRECGHYDRWREDFDLVREIGCSVLRYGPPYYSIHVGPGRYDWSFTDEVLPELRRRGIVPIVDLCHFGVPEWLGDFQNEDFPRFFAEYARAFAERYPWVRLYTPVNEMYITAEFSAYYGWWNERLKSHAGFVTAVKNITRANMEAMLAILQVRADALFILCESSEHTHANHPELVRKAQMFNERRYLTLDLTVGRRVNSGMYVYLMDNGMTNEEYTFYLQQDLREHFIIGHDYYVTNEHLLVGDEVRHGSGEIFGYYVLARAYHDRYHLPIMHTETNERDGRSVDWLWKTWANIQQLRLHGVPVCGMTWYSLTDQIDWDTALRENNQRVHSVGLYDLDRNVRAAGKAYKRMIEQWRNTPLLPHGPLTLVGDLIPDALLPSADADGFIRKSVQR